MLDPPARRYIDREIEIVCYLRLTEGVPGIRLSAYC